MLTYAVGVGYGFLFWAAYENFVAIDYEYFGFYYEASLWQTYLAVVLITPAFLLLMPRVPKGGSLAYLFTYIFVFFPVVFVAVGSQNISFWPYYLLLSGSMLLIAFGSLLSIPLPALRVSPRAFIVIVLFPLVAVCLSIAWRVVGSPIPRQLLSGLDLDFFETATQLRALVVLTPVEQYAINLFVHVFSPILLSITLIRRKYVQSALIALASPLLFTIYPEKTMLFTPVLVIGMYVMLFVLRWERRPWLVLGCLLPFAFGTIFIVYRSDAGDLYTTYVNMRLYTLAGLAFHVYHEFFDTNPHTAFTHIGIVGALFGATYDKTIAELMHEVYQLGRFNAHFWMADALVAVGPWFIPVMSLLCAIVLFAFNSACRHLDQRFVMMAACVAFKRLSEDALTTTLLTGGLGLLIVLLYVMPRVLSVPIERPAPTPPQTTFGPAGMREKTA